MEVMSPAIHREMTTIQAIRIFVVERILFLSSHGTGEGKKKLSLGLFFLERGACPPQFLPPLWIMEFESINFHLCLFAEGDEDLSGSFLSLARSGDSSGLSLFLSFSLSSRSLRLRSRSRSSAWYSASRALSSASIFSFALVLARSVSLSSSSLAHPLGFPLSRLLLL